MTMADIEEACPFKNGVDGTSMLLRSVAALEARSELSAKIGAESGVELDIAKLSTAPSRAVNGTNGRFVNACLNCSWRARA